MTIEAVRPPARPSVHPLEGGQVPADLSAGGLDAPVVDAPAIPRRPWHRAYRALVLAVDAVVLAVAVVLADGLRFATTSQEITEETVTYSVLGAGIALLWWTVLQLYRAADPRMLGHGPDEYRRVLQASMTTFGLVAIVSLLTKTDLSRGYLAIAFPVGLAGLLLGRTLLRRWLKARRAQGGMTTNVMLIGGVRSAESINAYFERHRKAGFRVTGVWVPDDVFTSEHWLHHRGRAIPVMGGELDLEAALRESDAGAVIVTDTEHLGHHGIKELTWELEALHVELMVSPNVMDVATPRITLRTVGSMPFLHLEEPQYEGATRWGKVLFDRSFAAVAVVVLLPVMVVTGLAVKLGSRGPVLYRSERIGVGGVPFQMYKFRSMVVHADRVKDELESDEAGVLFKMKDDPRVTGVGKVIRRFSLDELPQLFNVLRGDMSIVGPRPPLRSEVDHYDEAVNRRLLVKQGITGMWQVSGRSDLSWEDTVRLDLYYVENWSLVRDVQIIWRTLRAVVSSDGAY